MKIHIVGASGVGKTVLAQKLHQKYAAPVFSPDDLFWDNDTGAHSVKRSEAARSALPAQVLQQENRITEGVQHTWCAACFATADVIYVLATPRAVCRARIIRRFFARKLHRESRNSETLSSLLHLLRWTDKFYAVNVPQIRTLLAQYPGKTVILHGRRNVNTICKN